MMYGTGQAREPRSLGRRMSDSVIAAVHGIDGGALHWDVVGHVACGTIADDWVPTHAALTYPLCLLRSAHGRRRSLFCCSGRGA